MDLIQNNAPIFINGLLETFQLSVVILFFAIVLSLFFGVLSVTRYRIFKIISICYVELFRDIPLLVNVFFVYFGAPLIGIPLGPFAAATISLSLWGGANGAEIVRSGFNSVSNHQKASAKALGLKPWEIFWYVIGPQALIPIIPPFTGLFSLLIQATALSSMVGEMEFFRMAQIVVESTTINTGYSPAFIVYGFVLIVYFVICASLAALTKRLERWLSERQDRRGAGLPAVERLAQESV